MSKINTDDRGIPIQVFTPNPAWSTTLTIANGSVTWTIPDSAAEAYCFQPSGNVVRKLGANSSGPSFAGSPDSPYGPYGIKEGMTQVVFTGTNGVTIHIEVM